MKKNLRFEVLSSSTITLPTTESVVFSVNVELESDLIIEEYYLIKLQH